MLVRLAIGSAGHRGRTVGRNAVVALSQRSRPSDNAVLRVRRISLEDGEIFLETARDRGKLRVRQTLVSEPGDLLAHSVRGRAGRRQSVGAAGRHTARSSAGHRGWIGFYGRDDMQRLLQELKQETGVVRLAEADFIIDVGFGVGNRDGYEAVIEPLERVLRELGVRRLAIGGSRKVTEELHLLPADRQIGQSGVRVNPQVLLAIGISGAPQHLDYIGPRATVLAFNRDPEAPLLTLNQRRPRPRVFPIVGDLFETIPAFMAALARWRVEPKA